MVTIFCVFSHSAKAGNLLNSKNWIFNPPLGSGTAGTDSLDFMNGPGSVGFVAASQTFTTVPGQTYILQYDAKAVKYSYEELAVTIATASGAVLVSQSPNLTTTNSLQGSAFTATSTSTSLQFWFSGNNSALLTHLSVTLGSYSRPGKYTGTVTVTRTIPPAKISLSSTNSVIAWVTPSGGATMLTAPFGDFFGGLSNGLIYLDTGDGGSGIALSSAPVSYTLDGDALSFTVTAPGLAYHKSASESTTSPLDTTSVFSLSWVSD